MMLSMEIEIDFCGMHYRQQRVATLHVNARVAHIGIGSVYRYIFIYTY